MATLTLPKCLKGKDPQDAYQLAHSIYMGRMEDHSPQRHQIRDRTAACSESASGYHVCISAPQHHVTEGYVSGGWSGTYEFDRYIVEVEDPVRGKMNLELRREWGNTGVMKDYTLYLWNGARALMASTTDTLFGNWGHVTGDRQALSVALFALCRKTPKD